MAKHYWQHLCTLGNFRKIVNQLRVGDMITYSFLAEQKLTFAAPQQNAKWAHFCRSLRFG